MPRQGDPMQNNIYHKQKSQILKAIAKYKNQKQRPSEKRIIHELHNRYGTTEKEVSDQLKMLVTNGDVLRVTLRGQSSYKDASLVLRTAIEGTTDYRCFVKEAIDNILHDQGATLEEIENYIKDRCGGESVPQTDLSAHVRAALDKMQASDKVVKEGAAYRMAESAPEGVSQSQPRTQTEPEAKAEPETEQENEEESMEPPLKRKKGNAPSPTCDCRASAGNNRKGDTELQICCSDCCNAAPRSTKDVSHFVGQSCKDKESSCNIKNFNPAFATWILIAVAKIKSKKQRPTEERISHELQTHYDVTNEEVCEQLRLCVENGTLSRILTSGQTTYKDLSSTTSNGHAKVHFKKSEDFAIKILKAISKIKGQRQRPSEDRIVHELHCQYGLPKVEVSQQLKLCVKNGKVSKVTHKGQKTYKDPAPETKSSNVKVQERSEDSEKTKYSYKCATLILKAIAKFKNQKQKANEERISRELQTQHGLAKEQVSAQLKLCVRKGKVLRVVRNGQPTYKDPLAMKDTSQCSRKEDPKPLKYEKRILRAIAKYKSQHQRSSEEKISRELQRRCGLTKEQACKELRQCVKYGRVLKVTFKGQTSYRDPKHLQSSSSCGKRTSDFRLFIRQALNSVEDHGATVQTIKEYIRQHCGANSLPNSVLSTCVRDTLQRLITAKIVVKKGKHYRMAKHSAKDLKPSPKPPPTVTKSERAEKNRKGCPVSPVSCNGCDKSVCYDCAKHPIEKPTVVRHNTSNPAGAEVNSSQGEMEDCSPFVVIPIPGTLVTLDMDVNTVANPDPPGSTDTTDPPGHNKVAAIEEGVRSIKSEMAPSPKCKEDMRDQKGKTRCCGKSGLLAVKQEPGVLLTCSSPLNCIGNLHQHHVATHHGKEVSCKEQENSDDGESCGETSSSSSSSEDSESELEEEKDGKPAACNDDQSSVNRKSIQLYSETNRTNIPVYSSTFQRNWHEAHESISELVGSFKVMDADMGVSSIENLSPSFESKVGLTGYNLGVDEDMNPVVDFPDTDSTALIKELCAEVFSIEVPGHADLVSDED